MFLKSIRNVVLGREKNSLKKGCYMIGIEAFNDRHVNKKTFIKAFFLKNKRLLKK